MELNQWHSLRVTYYSYNNYVALELNGNLVGFTTFKSVLSGLRLSSGSLYIGKTSSSITKPPATLINHGFIGCIDQVSKKYKSKMLLSVIII